ncbi:MAG TPA: amine dehydrogenase large subunit [Gammaproteobacteria bacterium]|jgi:methylamine dehydrogenase heavy chain|nr:amine dehydrogenase large subunit [Gammaproteobacteria bacterium]
MHRPRIIGWLAAVLCIAPALAADPPNEQVTTQPLPPANAHRVYLADFTINHVMDGRLNVIDGEKLKLQGIVATGFAGLPTLSPDRSELYVATTYYTRLNHGDRVDVVDVYDLATLGHKAEIPIPPKHAMALPYQGVIRTSVDGRLLFVQNATPAQSVSVVDLRTRQFVAEVQTPGCWIILPSQTVAPRFTTLCGDGTLLTVTLDDDGKQKSMKRSERFFDPDRDPLFVQAENVGDRYFFVSFNGRIHTADVGGEVARFEPSWPLVSAPEARAGWRPGGYQPLALHQRSGRLYVAMHARGSEGSHKNPAKEIWVFDVAAKKRVARAPGSNAIAIATSRDDTPRLYAIDGVRMGLAVYDTAPRLVPRRRMEGVAEAGTLLVMH